MIGTTIMEELRLVVLTKSESEGAASLKLSHACIRVNFKSKAHKASPSNFKRF